MSDSRIAKISDQLLLIWSELEVLSLEVLSNVAKQQDDEATRLCFRQAIGHIKAARTWLGKVETK